MDVLVEMTPGSGWLAREGDRIVFLPTAESVDIAHDVIEPLLIPRNVNDSFATLRGWIEAEMPLPQMTLISLEPTVRVFSHSLEVSTYSATSTNEPSPLPEAGATEIVELGEIACLVVNDDAEVASGMLVEGVVRAGGLRLHFHRGWGADGSRSTNQALPNSLLEVELDDRRLGIGNGLVLGRWPYSHPDFDEALEPLILNDPAVSRLHATITPTNEGVFLRDYGSHNGTWVVRASGESVEVDSDTPQLLFSKDQIRVGDTIMTILEAPKS